MKISKAIEILTLLKPIDLPAGTEDDTVAINLAIEALKAVQTGLSGKPIDATPFLKDADFQTPPKN